jgi:hypothetical protein
MNKQFVPYTLALKLKELGFDEPCLKMGMSDIDIINTERTDEGDYPKNSHLFSGWITIPTYSAAFRWFREKYKLHSTITSISQESWQWHITKPGESLGKMYQEDFYTYEETESACLDKLIEIVKNNAHI